MRNRIAGISTTPLDDLLDEESCDERAAAEFARWTPSQRRVRRLFARLQRRRVRRMLRMHSNGPRAMEGERAHAETQAEARGIDRPDTGWRGADSCHCAGGRSGHCVDRLRGRRLDGDTPVGGVAEDRRGAAGGQDVAAERMPGDAEAAGAIAQMRGES